VKGGGKNRVMGLVVLRKAAMNMATLLALNMHQGAVVGLRGMMAARTQDLVPRSAHLRG